jgi:hypothetical protein
VSDCYLTPNHQYEELDISKNSGKPYKNTNFDDDDEVRFVLDQHAELDFYSASSLKQQYAGRNVTPFGHIILIPSQQIFPLSP